MNVNDTDIKWQFSPIPNIEESNFNKILERFFNLRVSGLVRENIQNALDGRLQDTTGPVVVKIETGTIEKKHIPGIDEVIARIRCLNGRNRYAKEAIAHMVNKVNQEEVAYISFEDQNTRGLKGAQNGQSNSKDDTWAIYAYNKGVHFEEENEAMETSRGGSHGVGKIASNAASDLNVMYFANCDADGNQHLGGTVQLIEHMYEGQCYRSSGYFTDIEVLGDNKTKFYPFENTFHPVFAKQTRGLKIIIPFLRDEYNSEVEIVKSVCDSFFISILEEKLEVYVNEKKISKDTLQQYVHSDQYYEQNRAEMKENFTPLYVDTYVKQKPFPIQVSNGFREYTFQLYFQYDEQIARGRVAIVRTIGMKIEDKKVKGNVNKPFNAVLMGGSDEDAYLKSLENESHTELAYEHIKDPILQRQAKKFINNLSKKISEVIEEAVKKNNPTDGLMNTKDILYVVENTFKKELENVMTTVKVNNGRTIVKRKETKPKKGEEKGKKTPPVKPVKPKDTDTNLGRTLETYTVNPDYVQRIIVGDREILQFDFRESKQVSKQPKCNIKVMIVDGTGQEYDSVFSIIDNYSRVVDRARGEACTVNANKIKNVSIVDGVIHVELTLRSSFNRALKFMYYVEV